MRYEIIASNFSGMKKIDAKSTSRNGAFREAIVKYGRRFGKTILFVRDKQTGECWKKSMTGDRWISTKVEDQPVPDINKNMEEKLDDNQEFAKDGFERYRDFMAGQQVPRSYQDDSI